MLFENVRKCEVECKVFLFAAAKLLEFKKSSRASIMELTDETRKKQCLSIANGMVNSALHDVTVLIGCDQIEFKVNRVFMALISDAFQAMLFRQMQEGQRDSEVIIEDIDPNGFQCVLNYAYCKDPAITMDNVVAVKCICWKLDRSIMVHRVMTSHDVIISLHIRRQILSPFVIITVSNHRLPYHSVPPTRNGKLQRQSQ